MAQILLTHLTGARAGEKHPINSTLIPAITFGRDSDAAIVKFDPIKDDLASRLHARIVLENSDGTAGRYILEDLGSSNGTYVDGVRVQGRAPLRSGSVILFGIKGDERGPEVQFEVKDPQQEERRAAAPTRVGTPPKANNLWETVFPAPPRDGQTNIKLPKTIDVKKGRSRLLRWKWIVVLVGVLAAASYLGSSRIHRIKSGEAILQQNRGALASVALTWKLYDKTTGRQAYHWQVKNPFTNGVFGDAFRDKKQVPVYVKLSDGTVEPVLMLDDERDTNRAVGGAATGSAFVVHRAGFLLTSRALGAPWKELYSWSPDATPGLLVNIPNQSFEVLREPIRWTPETARFVITRYVPIDALRAGQVNPGQVSLDGRLDLLNVKFAGSSNSIVGTLASVSEKHSVALLKVNPVEPLPVVEVQPQGSLLQVADRAWVLGCAGGAGAADCAGNAPTNVVVNVIPGPPSATASTCKECYWLTEGAAAPSNFGAPVLDDRGRVAGIFQMMRVGGQNLSYATPIRFGVEVTGTAK